MNAKTIAQGLTFAFVTCLAAPAIAGSQGDDRDNTQQDAEATATRLMAFGERGFRSPETVIHDEREDVYLVSNVNGKLTGADDNGFISRVSPEGRILDLKWIDGASGHQVTLHGPKDMLLTDRHLIVADVGAVRWFDRNTGKPVHAVVVPDARLLNGLAFGDDEQTIYVSDTGAKTGERHGAIYRIGPDGKPQKITSGPDLDRPNGISWHDGALLVAPFGQHARELYGVSPSGDRAVFTRLPGEQLDGLVKLDDGSFIVTSWKEKAVYRTDGNRTETLATGITQPAQPGYDAKRRRVLVPAARDNKVIVYSLRQE